MSSYIISTDPTTGLITVCIGDFREEQVSFLGKWVVDPDDDPGPLVGPVEDVWAIYGVADTARGQVAVYRYHGSDDWPATLKVYDSIDDAEEQGLPSYIVNRYRLNRGEVLFLDI